MFDHIKEFLFVPSIWDGRLRVRPVSEAYDTLIRRTVARLAGLLVLGVFGSVSAAGATNEWTKPSSGYWEESYWSFGRLPQDQDDVAFRNSNWKALAIGANTTSNYAGSLSISNLLVEAPTYSFNQLLLNWAGLRVPLSVRSNLTIGVNGSLASHYSALHAANFEINGPTSFSDAAVGVFNQIVVGHLAAAELDLQDGSISCGRFVLGSGAQGTYKQSGGTLTTTNIEIGGSASFSLLGGAVSNSGLFTIRGPSAIFVAAATSQRLGKLQITNNPGSASLDLAPGSNSVSGALLRFQDSRDLGWSGTLRILNFSTNHPGYGPDHIFVGTNSQGVTSDQLSRVTFVRPDDSVSNYSAAITSSGELVPGAAQGQDFVFSTNNGAITITGYTGPGGDVIIPSTITGLPVTAIGDFAFYQIASVTRVTIADSVTKVGNLAFGYCENLSDVVIGSSVTTIGKGAFEICSSLTNVAIPASVSSIGDQAFYYCVNLSVITVNPNNAFYSSVDGVLYDKAQTTLILFPPGKAGSYTIPGSVRVIEDSAFDNCTRLTDIVLPANLASIGDYAFSSCANLSSVTIPNSVTNLGSSVFESCSSLTNVVIGNSVTAIGEYAFLGCTSLLRITIGGSVTSIADQAFAWCGGLASVIIPNSVTSIGNTAFEFCYSLTNVAIGSGVTAIGVSAFDDCTSLTTIIVDPNNSSYSSLDGVLFNKTRTTLLLCPQGKAGGYTIPSSVVNIEDFAFYNCTSLTSVVIPNSVSNMGAAVFEGCSGLTNVTVGNGLSTIPLRTFRFCGSLLSINIPNGVTSIGRYAFEGCTSLTSISIPSSVTSIELYAFVDCSSLTAIMVDPNNSSYSSLDGVLFNKSQTELVSFPGGITGPYTIPNSVISIGDLAFYDCTNLRSITISSSVNTIGDSAFYSCSSLTSITIPNSVATIEDYAFEQCTGLTNVFMGSGLTTIGSYAFSYCTHLTALYFACNAPSAGVDVFSLAPPTIYYLPGTSGWGPTFAGRPTALWQPKADTSPATFGVRSNQFGFTISWAGARTVIVEARTNLSLGAWIPLSTNTLIDGSFYFSDRQWTNYPVRFYRLHAP